MIRRIDKPWGHELLLAFTDRYAGKILHIRSGEALSLQYHRLKDESIYVQSGRLRLLVGGNGRAEEGGEDPLAEKVLSPGDACHLPPRTRHRFEAIEDTTLIEVSSPELDDVVRLEDRYGRAGTSEP